MNLQYNLFEPIAYFAARLMYSLNSYGRNGKYYNKNKEVLFRGCIMPFTSLLQYEKSKEKVILCPAFFGHLKMKNTLIYFLKEIKFNHYIKQKKNFHSFFL